MNKHFNIILSNAPINNGNRGCVALSVSAMMLIADILEKNNIECTFYLCDSGFEDRMKHSVSVGDKIMTYIDVPNPGNSSFKDVIKHIVKFKQTRRDLTIFRKADYMLDLGQGDSFSDIYGKGRFDTIFKSYVLAQKYKIPFCVLPQTIGPYKDCKIRECATKGINNARCVLVRDKQSFDYTKQLLPDKEVNEIIDVAFYLPYIRKQFSKEYIHVGLNISSLLWNGGYTRDNQFGLKDDYQKVIRNIIDFFLAIPNVKLHLIPHVVDSERSIENDYEVSFDLCEEYQNEHLVLAPLFLDPVIAKSYIAGMDFFMGARMHATIAAFSSGVPVVPMAYSRKFNGLFEDTLQYHHLVDLKTMVCADILNIVTESFNDREILKREIIHQQETTIVERREMLDRKLSKFFHLE